MGKILCATRGGPDSRRTMQAAIALARERGDELIFLYIADASFLDTIAAPVVVDVDAELDRMGRFQLEIAREQAADQGVEARLVIRHGRVGEELVAAARELGATVVVLGRPRGEDAVFDEAALRTLARDLEFMAGAEVHIA